MRGTRDGPGRPGGGRGGEGLRRLLVGAAIAAVVAGGFLFSTVLRPGEPGPGMAPTPSPRPQPPAGEVRLEEVARLSQPLGMAVRDGDDRLYVAQKTGQVVALRGGRKEVVLDIGDEVSAGEEQGLLGLTFSPEGRFLYIHYTDTSGTSRIHEFRVDDTGVDLGSRREVLVQARPHVNHNCGHLAFGPDGLLYICLGDGSVAGDPEDHGQNTGTLLGSMLRISPRPEGGRPYGIPEDNPFVGEEGAREEIWAYGFRNPWRFSFDRQTRDLWMADVGQVGREEINVQPADSEGGENYGWARMEGTMPFRGEEPPDHVPPVYEYPHRELNAVIGGYVYRGDAIPSLRGTYLFGDLYDPELMGLRLEDGEVEVRELGVRIPTLVAFGEGHEGELYAMSLEGPLYRIVAP